MIFIALRSSPPTPSQMRENHQGRRRLLLHRRLSSRDDGSRERKIRWLLSASHFPHLLFSSAPSPNLFFFFYLPSLPALPINTWPQLRSIPALAWRSSHTHIATTPTTYVMWLVFIPCVRSKSPSNCHCIFFLEWNPFCIHFRNKNSLSPSNHPVLGPISRNFPKESTEIQRSEDVDGCGRERQWIVDIQDVGCHFYVSKEKSFRWMRDGFLNVECLCRLAQKDHVPGRLFF